MKRITAILLCLLLTFSMAGCGFGSKKQADYTVYEISVDGKSLYEVGYNTETKDTEKLVEELFQQLHQTSENADFSPALSESIEVEDYSIESQILRISFSRDYSLLTGSKEILTRAAVVKTMLQIPDIYGVEFQVHGEDLTNADGKSVGIMTADTFLTDFGNDANTETETTLTLYYASKDGKSLIKEKREVRYNSNNLLGRVILEYLTATPENPDAMAPFDSSVTVKSLAVSDGVCYVTFDSSINNFTDAVSENVIIYSIVDSLSEIDGVSKVKITIDTENSDNATSSESMDGIYEKDLSLVTNLD